MAQEGINADRVTAWFRDRVEGVSPPLAFDLIAGGRSNLTYRVTDSAGRSWALRRPPVLTKRGAKSIMRMAPEGGPRRAQGRSQ